MMVKRHWKSWNRTTGTNCIRRYVAKKDGIEVCKTIRSDKNLVPILMLTAKDDEFDRVLGLELGADDYMTKPFSPRGSCQS